MRPGDLPVPRDAERPLGYLVGADGGPAQVEVECFVNELAIPADFGPVLDIDGVTGGFNFQAAWTTGFIAGQLNG